MSNIFTTTSTTPQDFSTFDLSHQRKMTMKPGELIPIFLNEVVPGDRFKISHAQIIRAQPMLAPIMHEVQIKTYFFFVPNRILFDEKFGSDKTNPWVQFIRGGESGTDIMPIPYLHEVDPVEIVENGVQNLNVKNAITNWDTCVFKNSTLWDYLALPAATSQLETYFDNSAIGVLKLPDVQILPFMAYHKIWNDYFRYESIQPEFDFLEKVKIGPNTTNDLASESMFWSKMFTLKKKAWEHDLFTSALPDPQRGAPVTLPIYGDAPIRFDGDLGTTTLYPTGGPFEDTELVVTAGNSSALHASTPNQQNEANVDVSANHYVDLTQAVATTIQDLRKAVKLQEWLELGMRAGTRYFEFIKAYFNVSVSDDRLQRAEFIGGATSNVIISEVIQNSATVDSTPLGDMAGHGINIGNSDGVFSKFVEEYGYIVGLACIIPRTAYQNTVPKHWLKKDKFDIFTAQFQHVGEQALTNQEVNYNWLKSAAELNEDTFGYVPRYSEYKFQQTTVHGDFTDNLNYWVWNRKFSQEQSVALDSEFISSTPSRDIFAYTEQTGDPFLAHFHFRVQAKRHMDYLGEPKFA